jgi:hypothetical protein
MRRAHACAAMAAALAVALLLSATCAAEPLAAIDPSLNPWFPIAALGRDGGLLVVWEDRRDFGPDIYGQSRDADGAALWGEGGRPLAAWPRRQERATIMSDGDGGLYLAWLDNRRNPRDVYLQRFDAAGRHMWLPEDGMVICAGDYATVNQRIVSDGRGGVYITWTDVRSGVGDVYGQRVTPNGTRVWDENGRYICRAEGDQYDPLTASDGAGGFVVVWTNIVDGQFRVAAQRVSPAGVRLWREDGVRACLAQSVQGSPAVVGSLDGSAFVFWVDYRHDDGSYSALDVYGQLLTPDGRRGWGPGGIPLCAADGSQRNVVAVSDGEGGAYVAWVDTRDTFDDIYVQRVDADGSLLWGEDGRPVGVGPGVQRGPALSVRDGHLWVAWHDYRRESRSQTLQDIYVQSFDGQGLALYPPGGSPVATSPADRTDLAILALGSQAWALWTEHHGPRRQALATRLSP